MLEKDPEQRISLMEISQHQWVTCNGLQPMQFKLYPKVTIVESDTAKAIGKVSTIELIRIRMKNKVKELRERKKSEVQ